MSLSAYTSNTPSLYLDFSKGKSLDPRITFTRNSVATLFNSSGYIEQVPTNFARIDHNPFTKVCRGLLIEEGRTNLLPASQNLDNTTHWTPVRSSVLSFSTTSPSGATDAFKIVEDISNNSHYISAANFTSTANSTWTISVFAKAAERSLFQLIFRDSALTNGFRVEFNLSNGTATAGAVYGSGTNITQSATPIGNGWYRCVMTGTVDAASTSFSLQSFLEATSATLSYTGAFGFGLHMWGAQAEIGAFATSYIPSTVTFTNRTTPGTFFDSSGTLLTASSGVARTTYTQSNLSAPPYLLLEEARTNFIRNNTASGAVNGAIGSGGSLPTGWSSFIVPTGLTTTVNGTGTEKGINYVDLRVNGTPSNTGEITFYFESAANTLFAAGTAVSLSSWLSIPVGTPVNISSYSLRVMSYNGASYISEATNNSLTPTSVLTRYSVNNYVTAAGSDRVSVALTMTPNSVSALDVTIRIGLPQLEVGGYITSVITTAGGTSTRAADTYTTSSRARVSESAHITNLNPWFNPSEGTLYAEASSFYTQTLTAYPRLAVLSDGSGQTNTIQLIYVTNADLVNAAVWTGGVNQAMWQAGPAMSNCKVAIAYKANDTNAAINGVVQTTDTACTIPTVTRLSIGVSGNDVGQLCGWVSSVIYYQNRLSNTELPLLTV